MKKLQGNDPLVRAMRKFLSWLEVSNYSPRTVGNRQKSLMIFREWCSDRAIDTPSEITKKVLEQYRRHLFQRHKANGERLKASTQGLHLSAVRVFFSWLSRNNLVLFNPASELDLPRTESILPRGVLSPADVDRVMDQPDINKSKGVRDRAILETFYSTGIRRLELINLNVDDVDFDKGLLFVRLGKGARDRVVPIGSRACYWIDKYLHEVRPYSLRNDTTTFLFLTRDGSTFHPDSLTKMVRNYMRGAGINGQASCHLLRHSMATSMLENGAGIRYIQAILGHASLDNTQIYTRVSILKLKEIHARTHPARLKKDSRQ